MPLPPPPICSFASFKVYKKPPRARGKIAKSVVAFCSSSGIKLGGFVRRMTNEELEVLLVLENYSERSFDPLWEHLKSREFARVGSIDFDSFKFVSDDFTNASLLDYNFRVLSTDGENEGWSIFDEVDAEGDGYSLVSSLRW